MDGEHIYSATIVLVMVCAAFPADTASTLAMNAGLGLLRAMGERGNSHMGARYELLAKLYTGVMPEAVVPISEAVPQAPVFSDGVTARGPGLSPQATAPHGLFGFGPVSTLNAGHLTFPVMNNNSLEEPLYDENASSGMDFGLWEEGFAYTTMDLDFDLAQRHLAPEGGAAASNPAGPPPNRYI